MVNYQVQGKFLCDTFAFTFLVGILPSSTLRTFRVGPVKKTTLYKHYNPMQCYNFTMWNIFFLRWFLVVRSIKWAKWEKMSAESRFYTHVMMWPLSNTRILRWLSVMANIVTSPIAHGLKSCMSWFIGLLLRLPFIVVLSLHCKSGLQ